MQICLSFTTHSVRCFRIKIDWLSMKLRYEMQSWSCWCWYKSKLKTQNLLTKWFFSSKEGKFHSKAYRANLFVVYKARHPSFQSSYNMKCELGCIEIYTSQSRLKTRNSFQNGCLHPHWVRSVQISWLELSLRQSCLNVRCFWIRFERFFGNATV